MVLTFCAPRSIPRFLSLRKGRHLPTPQVCSLRMSIAAPASEEHFDVLHEDGTPKGYTKARSLVHRDGDWHRTTHIWVLSSDGRVLIQKRSADKDTFPGRWDVSVGGHISAGSESATSARRELEEELGIIARGGNDLEFVMTVKAQATGSTMKHGTYMDNEIQDVYIFWPRCTVELEQLVLQEEEVERAEYWEWTEYVKRTALGDEGLVPRSPMYRELFFPWLSARIAARRGSSEKGDL